MNQVCFQDPGIPVTPVCVTSHCHLLLVNGPHSFPLYIEPYLLFLHTILLSCRPNYLMLLMTLCLLINPFLRQRLDFWFMVEVNYRHPSSFSWPSSPLPGQKGHWTWSSVTTKELRVPVVPRRCCRGIKNHSMFT